MSKSNTNCNRIVQVSHLTQISARKAYITIAIRLRYDYDEKLTCSFFARVEWKQARAVRRNRIVVVS